MAHCPHKYFNPRNIPPPYVTSYIEQDRTVVLAVEETLSQLISQHLVKGEIEEEGREHVFHKYSLLFGAMLLEAVNSVFITFLATEYLLFNDHKTDADAGGRGVVEKDARSKKNSIIQQLTSALISQHSRPLRYTFAIVLAINAFVRFHEVGVALADWLHNKVETFFHIPRIIVAICSFLLALYWDCRQKYKQNAKQQSSNPAPWSNRYFFQQLLKSFCKLLPVYPFLAVIISFGFLFLITVFEKLDLPLEYLNMPIYYGTLYG